jgi:ribosomal protein S18 acetylase RimI-like enzyme
MDRIERYSEATPAQQEQYVALYIATWQDEPYREWFTSEEVLANAELNRELLYLLLDEAGLVAGFVGGRPLTQCEDFFVNACVPPIDLEKGFYIDELGVARGHRKAGIGAQLTEHLIEVARSRQFNQFVLRTHQSPDNPAKRLYERLGFQPRLTAAGTVHGVNTTQTRIDANTPPTDFRIYYYKVYAPPPDVRS